MKVLKHISKTVSADKASRVEVYFAFDCVLEMSRQAQCQRCVNTCCSSCPFYHTAAQTCFVSQFSWEELPQEAIRTDETRLKTLSLL